MGAGCAPTAQRKAQQGCAPTIDNRMATFSLHDCAQDLGAALDALAKALVHRRHDDLVSLQARLATLVPAFQEAVGGAVAAGTPLDARDEAVRLQVSLGRCRRLGTSLTQTTERVRAAAGASSTYTSVGSARQATGERPTLNARG